MAYHDDLLDQALHLACRDPKRPKQANLRRAISTAYYALFHLLIAETVSYWRLGRQRALLARAFEHRKMRGVCNSCKSPDADVREVAKAFVELQQARQLADYDNARVWARVDAMTQIGIAKIAFQTWRRVRTETVAQDFLLSLLIPDRR